MEANANEFRGTDRFEVRKRVGAGGMGVVYEAFDRQNRMRVALKTLPEFSPAALYRFKQEFRNVAGVTHPNLAALYELFAVEGTWFFSMEFVDGWNLLDYIRYGEKGPPTRDWYDAAMTPSDQVTSDRVSADGVPFAPGFGIGPVTQPAQFARLRASFRELVEAIEALHNTGKLHRDVKPTNVMVSRAGSRTVLLDFGLTIAARDEDDEKNISGTPAYMSPEQAAAEPLTTATDWYAVGVMLFEALTGRIPFEEKGAILLAKRTCEPPRPSDVVPGVPKDLDDLCFALLSRDAAVRPAASEILQRLGSHEPPKLRVMGVDGIPLIGRRDHMNALRAGMETVRGGQPLAMYVHGASGDGKSFLVNRFAEELVEANVATVLVGRCYEAESVPYKALDSLIDAVTRHLIHHPQLAAEVLPRDARLLMRVFPILQNVPAFRRAPERSGDNPSDQELRARATRALRDQLARLGERVPLVLCIDDLQWGDVDSGTMISDILSGPDAPVLLFIGVYRTEYAATSPILKMLIEDAGDGVERRFIPLSVLTHVEARVLASELMRRFDPEANALAEVIARESRGVPYFVHELVRFVRSGAELTESISLDQVLSRRVEALPPAARRLLETIALAGQPIRQVDACDAADLVGEDRAAVSLLRADHMVRSSGTHEHDVVETYHDRIRETLVAQLRADDRRQHHLRLGEVLERAGSGDAETLAIHFRSAGLDAKAAGYFISAADRAAAALAFDRAASLYREALRLGYEDEDDSVRLSLADALANAGRGSEAAEEYGKAARTSGTHEAIDLNRKAAYQYCISGHLLEGRQAMAALLAKHGVRVPSSSLGVVFLLLKNRFRLWRRGYEFVEREASDVPPEVLIRNDVLWSASAGLSMSDIVLGAGLQTYGLIEALNCGEVYRIARSMAWEATHNSNLGSRGWTRTAKLLELAQQLADRSGHPHAIGMAAMARGIAEFTMGRWATTVPQLDHADTLLRERCTGVAWELDTAHAFALWALCYKGDFAELGRRTAVLIKEAEDRGDLYAYATFGTFHHPHAILAASDDSVAARAFLDTSRAAWVTNGFYLQDLCALMTDALIDTYEDRGERGYQRYVDNWKKVKASQLLRSQCIATLTYHFRARAALNGAMKGNRPDLIRAAEADAKRILREKVAWTQPYGRLIEAGVAIARKNDERAVALLRESAEGLDRVDMFSHAASARLVLGEMLGGSEGEALVNQANAWFASQGVRNPRAMARLHVGAMR